MSTSVFFGKPLVFGQVEGAARAIDAVVAGTQAAGGAVHVAQEEVGGVDEHPAVRLGGDGEAPQHRLGERVFDRLALEHVGAARAERLVRLHQQHARADPLELDDAALAALAAIETEVVRARDRPTGPVDIRNSLSNLDISSSIVPRAFVPVERDEAVDLAKTGGAIFDGGQRTGTGAARLLRAQRRQ